ncbi:HD domain-containing phosphohydrolase [Candidatus Eisenbacteria bacterium]|uniref:HD domain-containing phosphohydrolase n=1 Tax=Eiseniibacteriota bacterium TaxID=2212470 RepID=A0ABV6YPE4_UNCEI
MLLTEQPELEQILSAEHAPADVADLLSNTKNIMESLDIGATLEQLGHALTSFVRVDALSLKLNGITEELLMVRQNGCFKHETIFGSKIMSHASFGRVALEASTPTVIDDIASAGFTFPAYVSREGFKSLVAVPLRSGKREMGIVTIYLKEAAPVSAEALAIVSIVASVTAAAVEHSQLVRRMETNYFSTVEALAAAIEAKDPYTRGHSKRVTQFAIVLAERFGVSDTELRTLQYGATLHDIGKIGIDEKILNKPGKLTPEEFEVIKHHPAIGEHIIERVDFLQGARPVVRSHHERFDGTGYPDGLRDEEIPFLARVCCVVDFYDALTSDRPYRPAFSVDTTIQYITEGIGSMFDPVIAKEFLEMSPVLSAMAQMPV